MSFQALSDPPPLLPRGFFSVFWFGVVCCVWRVAAGEVAGGPRALGWAASRAGASGWAAGPVRSGPKPFFPLGKNFILHPILLGWMGRWSSLARTPRSHRGSRRFKSGPAHHQNLHHPQGYTPFTPQPRYL